MKNIIVNYGIGNVGSILNMMKKVGYPAELASEGKEILNADRLLLPGIGAFDNCMKKLEEARLDGPLREAIAQKHIPILGICVGMQMFLEQSEEGERPGLGMIPGKVRRFRGYGLKIPHMGWNYVNPNKHPLFSGLSEKSRFYFVHSYYVSVANDKCVIAMTKYGDLFPSAIARKNIMGVQFHPEKSHKFGMQLLKNFVENF